MLIEDRVAGLHHQIADVKSYVDQRLAESRNSGFLDAPGGPPGFGAAPHVARPSGGRGFPAATSASMQVRGAVPFEPGVLFIRGWSPFADASGKPVPLNARRYLSGEQCADMMERVRVKVGEVLWGLQDSVVYGLLRNWQIVIHKKMGVSTSDFWSLQEAINSYLKGEAITVFGSSIYASMEQSPQKQERNSFLRAADRAVKSLAL